MRRQHEHREVAERRTFGSAFAEPRCRESQPPQFPHVCPSPVLPARALLVLRKCWQLELWRTLRDVNGNDRRNQKQTLATD